VNAGQHRRSRRVQAAPRIVIAPSVEVSTGHKETSPGGHDPSAETTMTHVYFHCSNADQLILDPRGIDVEDLAEAHQRAQGVIRAFVDSNGPDDWRAWSLHASDEEGEELFLMPFACVLGRLH
jgi:hypothetical protein